MRILLKKKIHFLPASKISVKHTYEILETTLMSSNLQPNFQNYHYHKDSSVVMQSFLIWIWIKRNYSNV